MCPSDQLPTTTITTMAAACRNGPLVLHMRPFVSHRCVRLVEDNPASKRMHFYRDWGGIPQDMAMAAATGTTTATATVTATATATTTTTTIKQQYNKLKVK